MSDAAPTGGTWRCPQSSPEQRFARFAHFVFRFVLPVAEHGGGQNAPCLSQADDCGKLEGNQMSKRFRDDMTTDYQGLTPEQKQKVMKAKTPQEILELAKDECA